MKKNPYISFDKYVLRTPLLPLSFFNELTQEDQVDTKLLKQTYSGNAIIQEAIFLASPTFAERLKKWCTDEITDNKEVEKLTFSLLKYLSRMCSRCTPFGLFAGTAVGSFDEFTKVELEPIEKFKRHTRFDMNYLIALSQNLAKDPIVRSQLRFYPNNSLYQIGKEWRYIEYHYNKSNRRIHQMVSLEDTDYLQTIIEATKAGAYLADLAQLLTDEEASTEETADFINELVNNQLLISELEPSVSGSEFSVQLMACLKKLKGIDFLIKTLDLAHDDIKSLDKELGNDNEDYLQITAPLKALGTNFDLKHMFQTDMVLSHSANTLSTAVKEKVLKTMILLAKTSPPSEGTLLSQFGKAFYERFENREVPLAKALDVEAGVGYKQNEGDGDINYLIDDIVTITQKESFHSTLSLTATQQILHRKLIENNKLQKKVIQLKDKDFEQFSPKWDDLADTLPTMIQVFKEGGEEKIYISGFGGSSAANLLARFAHGDDQIDQYIKEIVQKEAEINQDKILAEIVHLPEARVGNILMRPSFRSYEIPYLAKSILPSENQLSINDLVISAKYDGTVTLKSLSKQKEVIPRLSNAHNFSSQPLPIYHFLADLQTQGKRMLGFSWGDIAKIYKYLPRVEYDGIILSKAQWIISKKEIEDLNKVDANDGNLKTALKIWKKTHQIPQYVLLAESDNELLINMHNLTSVRMLLAEVKKKAQFKLSEFLHEGDTIVKQGSNQYTNQVIMSFVNTQKLKST